jgi:hypothetical protein
MKPRIIVIVAGCAFFLMCTVKGSGQRKQPLTLETIVGGGLSSPSPSELYWAPDGRHVAFFLPEGEGGARALWMLEVGASVCASTSRTLRLEDSKQLLFEDICYVLFAQE